MSGRTAIPKDLGKIKPKVAFNLTKRQLVCLGGGALIGVPLFFALRPYLGSTGAAMTMITVMVPAFLFGIYERQGQPLEKVLKQMILVCFIRPRHRPYETVCLYDALERQNRYSKEVRRILNGSEADRKTKKAAEGSGKKSRQKG